MANYTMTVGEMVNNPLTKNIFPDNYPFYTDDVQARKEFEEKFIEHFYYREIGFETPFMFKQRLESLLKLRMPYWTKLYETELEAKDINFLLNKDLRESFIRTIDSKNMMSGTTTTDQNSSSNATMTQDGTTSNNHKESMLNDGVSQSSLTDGYLTGTSSDNSESTSNGHSNTSDNSSLNSSSNQLGNETSTESTELISQGNIGITSSAQLLKEWRDVLINMDEIIIKECSQLFMKLY